MKACLATMYSTMLRRRSFRGAERRAGWKSWSLWELERGGVGAGEGGTGRPRVRADGRDVPPNRHPRR